MYVYSVKVYYFSFRLCFFHWAAWGRAGRAGCDVDDGTVNLGARGVEIKRVVPAAGVCKKLSIATRLSTNRSQAPKLIVYAQEVS